MKISKGPQQNIKVIVCGAPVTAAYAAQIGADGFAQDTSQAVAVAKSPMRQAA